MLFVFLLFKIVYVIGVVFILFGGIFFLLFVGYLNGWFGIELLFCLEYFRGIGVEYEIFEIEGGLLLCFESVFLVLEEIKVIEVFVVGVVILR